MQQQLMVGVALEHVRDHRSQSPWLKQTQRKIERTGGFTFLLSPLFLALGNGITFLQWCSCTVQFHTDLSLTLRQIQLF